MWIYSCLALYFLTYDFIILRILSQPRDFGVDFSALHHLEHCITGNWKGKGVVVMWSFSFLKSSGILIFNVRGWNNDFSHSTDVPIQTIKVIVQAYSLHSCNLIIYNIFQVTVDLVLLSLHKD